MLFVSHEDWSMSTPFDSWTNIEFLNEFVEKIEIDAQEKLSNARQLRLLYNLEKPNIWKSYNLYHKKNILCFFINKNMNSFNYTNISNVSRGKVNDKSSSLYMYFITKNKSLKKPNQQLENIHENK